MLCLTACCKLQLRAQQLLKTQVRRPQLSLQRHLSPAAKLLRVETVEPEGVSRPCVLSLPLSQHRSVSLQQELGGGEWGGK